MVYHTIDFIPSPDCQTTIGGNRGINLYVRAVALPFYEGLLGRIASAWQVLTGKAVAARYPQPGEFELALADRDWLPADMTKFYQNALRDVVHGGINTISRGVTSVKL